MMSVVSHWNGGVRIAFAICALLFYALPGQPAAADPVDVDKFMETSRQALIMLKVAGRDKNGDGENYGTAFFVSPRGFALTAAHLFHSDRDPANRDSRLRNGTIWGKIGSSGVPSTTFELVAFHPDPERDLALIKVVDPPAPTAFLKVCGSREPSTTERLVAFGFSFGQQLRAIKGTRDGGLSGSRYPTSMPINKGDSGAPIITEKGRVFGMALSGVREQQAQGFNYFMPLQFADSLLKDAQVKEDCTDGAAVAPGEPLRTHATLVGTATRSTDGI
jgi:S1-C subfamily serine protease